MACEAKRVNRAWIWHSRKATKYANLQGKENHHAHLVKVDGGVANNNGSNDE